MRSGVALKHKGNEISNARAENSFPNLLAVRTNANIEAMAVRDDLKSNADIGGARMDARRLRSGHKVSLVIG